MPTDASDVPVTAAPSQRAPDHAPAAATEAVDPAAPDAVPAAETPTTAEPEAARGSAGANAIAETVAAAAPKPAAAPRAPRARPKGRGRRFALPDMAADRRAEESIEAFLEGPELRRHKPAPKRRRRKAATQGQGSGPHSLQVSERPFAIMPRPSTDIRTLPGRLEWNAALERESLRALRYGRPAAVAIVELVGERPTSPIEPWMRLLAGPIASTLRGGSRATDLVARISTSRFQVLLPETPEAGAGRFAERMSTACRDSIESTGAPVDLRVCVAISTPDHSLHEALEQALRSIEAA